MADIFQLYNQTNFYSIFHQTTPEECTDITYTNQEIELMFSGYEYYHGDVSIDTIYLIRRDYTTCMITVINLAELSRVVKQQLTKSKEAVIDMSDIADTICFTQLNKQYFKQQGLKYRPSKGNFVAYKEPKRKLVVSKTLLNQLRNNTVTVIGQVARQKFGIDIQLKNCDSKEAQAKTVLFGINIGCSLAFMEEQSGSNWSEYDYNSEKYIDHHRSVREQVTKVLTENGQECMIEVTIQEYKDWLKSSSHLITS